MGRRIKYITVEEKKHAKYIQMYESVKRRKKREREEKGIYETPKRGRPRIYATQEEYLEQTRIKSLALKKRQYHEKKELINEFLRLSNIIYDN
jgi:hypothetical protein